MQKQNGFIKYIIIILVILGLLAFFNIDLREIFESESMGDNLGFLGEWGTKIWEGYLAPVWAWLWENIVRDYIWEPLVKVLEMAKNTQE